MEGTYLSSSRRLLQMRSAGLIQRPWPYHGAAAVFLAVLFLSVACGGRKDQGIEVQVLEDFSGTGIGDTDTYPDAFLTPSELRVALKSVKLIKAGDTSPSYTVFDTGAFTEPVILDLTTSAQFVENNGAYPTGCACEFSKVQIEVVYIDLRATVYNIDSPQDRRIRFYTLNLTDPQLAYPVGAGEVLFGGILSIPNFQWVNIDDGSFVPISGTRPTAPLQVPAAVFPNDVYSPTVTVDLPKFFEIPDKPKGIYTVTVTFHAANLFFFDETDAPPNGRFDLDTDGRLNANSPNSHYYPTFPLLSASGD